MDNATLTRGAKAYRKVDAQSRVEAASPYRLIQMLLQGILDKLAFAGGQMQNDQKALASKSVGQAIAIIDTLRMSLDKSIGGSVSQNLDDLYDYSTRRLLSANLEQKPEYLDEVANIIREIKAGWDAIPAETVREYEAKLPRA